jgi:hypothetical protein
LGAAVALLATAGAAAALAPDVEKALRDSTYVYIQSERKSGTMGEPAEIWFDWADGAVWVGTRPSSWRVRRIKAGRTKARIAVGRRDGPAFEATGAIVKDPKAEERMMTAFARKYPDRWPGYAEQFRAGFQSGDRVLVRYAPR